jgi:hypothetical protein
MIEVTGVGDHSHGRRRLTREQHTAADVPRGGDEVQKCADDLILRRGTI